MWPFRRKSGKSESPSKKPAAFEGWYDATDVDHAILESAIVHDLRSFYLYNDPENDSESYIDLLFERDGRRRLLRFHSPTRLVVRGVGTGSGIVILDISRRQLQDYRVMVTRYSDSFGAIPEFMARSVEEIDIKDSI